MVTHDAQFWAQYKEAYIRQVHFEGLPRKPRVGGYVAVTGRLLVPGVPKATEEAPKDRFWRLFVLWFLLGAALYGDVVVFTHLIGDWLSF